MSYFQKSDNVTRKKRTKSETVLETFDEATQLKVLLNFIPKQDFEGLKEQLENLFGNYLT